MLLNSLGQGKAVDVAKALVCFNMEKHGNCFASAQFNMPFIVYYNLYNTSACTLGIPAI